MVEGSVARTDWPLTARQLQCLERFWARKSAKVIGLELGISHHAVEKHLQAARHSLSVGTSIEAARLVFGDPQDATVRPYYDASEVHTTIKGIQSFAVSSSLFAFEGTAGEQAPINRLGPGMTLLAIVGVALASILAVALLVAAANGLAELSKGVFH